MLNLLLVCLPFFLSDSFLPFEEEEEGERGGVCEDGDGGDDDDDNKIDAGSVSRRCEWCD